MSKATTSSMDIVRQQRDWLKQQPDAWEVLDAAGRKAVDAAKVRCVYDGLRCVVGRRSRFSDPGATQSGLQRLATGRRKRYLRMLSQLRMFCIQHCCFVVICAVFEGVPAGPPRLDFPLLV